MEPKNSPALEIDEEIARVREARHQISEQFGHDPYRLVAHYVERQEAESGRLIKGDQISRSAKVLMPD